MRRLLPTLALLALMVSIASAECVCGGVDDPEGWYSYPTMIACYQPNGACTDPSQPVYEVDTWTCVHRDSGVTTSCQFPYCNITCDYPQPGFARAIRKPKPPLMYTPVRYYSRR